MTDRKRVLVTGMSGLIGRAVRQALEEEYDLSALNRRPVEGVPTTQADLGDLAAISAAFDGIDTVIHLAAVIHDGYGWDALLNTNVIGTRNVFEAAAAAGVRRVIFTSSGATVAGWEKEEPYASLVAGRYDEVPDSLAMISESMPTRPANLYAATKVWGEALARHYADNHGLEIISLRIGFANEADRPENARQLSVWNSQRDVVQAIRLAMSRTMQDRHECYFILSDNRRGYRDVTLARRNLGYEPTDSADAFELRPGDPP